jgi:hypothetical protein
MRFLFILMLCAGAGFASQAAAVTLGDTVTCSATLNYFCKHTPVSAVPIDATVGAAAEFEIDFLHSQIPGRFTVNFSDNLLTLTTLANFETSSAADFLTFGDLTHPITSITSFVVTVPKNRATSFTQSDFSVADGAITFDLAGQDTSSGVTIQIGLASIPAGVPEPASWAMMICGFGMAGGMMRHRRRGRASLA